MIYSPRLEQSRLVQRADMSSTGPRRVILRQLIRLACAQLAEQMLNDIKNRSRPIRKKRKWVREWIGRREKLGASTTLLRELVAEDPNAYRNILRLTQVKFDELLEMITPEIRKQDTVMRSAIPCRTKLEIALRYMGSGDSLMSLEYLFRVPHNTISTFLPSVLKAIYNALTPFIKVSFIYLILIYLFIFNSLISWVNRLKKRCTYM